MASNLLAMASNLKEEERERESERDREKIAPDCQLDRSRTEQFFRPLHEKDWNST